MSLKDKIVWITGASSGIGEATAYEFARNGAKLVLSARRKEVLDIVKENTGLSDADVLVLPLDMEKPADFEQAFSKVIAHFGKIDVLFNNAGISQRSLVLDTEMVVYKKLIDVDLLSVIALTKVVLPFMVNQKSGQIVVTSSVAGKVATPARSGYAAVKHALHGFFDALRAEVHTYNIGVNIICPGYIQTDISLNALSQDGSKYGKMDENQKNGLPVATCAKQIYNAVLKNKNEVYIGGKEVFGVYLKRFFPSLLDKIILKQAPK